MTVAPPETKAELLFFCVPVTHGCHLPADDCFYLSPDKNSRGESLVQLYATPSGYIMRFPHVADFLLSPGEIVCQLCDPKFDYMVEICLLGHVLSYYLELSGVAAIHAGAVAVDERAVLFAADRTGGKSTLVASMVKAGFPLLADDIAALEERSGMVACRHGFPQLKLTSEQALRFAGHADGFPLVHPAFDKLSVPAQQVGKVAVAALPVARVYLLERHAFDTRVDHDVEVQIESVAAGEVLIQLVRYAFLAEVLEGHGGHGCFFRGDGNDHSAETGGLRASRFHRLARITRGVAVKRLRYPSGYDLLPQVHAAVLADLNLPSHVIAAAAMAR
ncbi:hypothetical protein L861_02695 [Litchfieldella anticariensis FP35 = DSM 16096]|uniref:HPr kinase n=2 Tax=Litchfieldella anticariensis TaxID=258591 RepID=S2KQ92_LITA3|nr:hypothetical protein L861_02695 [Halomonas anticariensis FP35 = DSM 16096]